MRWGFEFKDGDGACSTCSTYASFQFSRSFYYRSNHSSLVLSPLVSTASASKKGVRDPERRIAEPAIPVDCRLLVLDDTQSVWTTYK